MLMTSDGVAISATHYPMTGAPGVDAATAALALCFVFVHGFTQHHRKDKSQKIIEVLRRTGGVIGIDMRGHGKSGGASIMARDEIFDLDAAVAWARRLGYARVVPVGFSLGGAVVLRHSSEGREPVEATVSVSAPAFWMYRGTAVMRRVHVGFLTRAGRAVIKAARGTSIAPPGAWGEDRALWPDSPADAVAKARWPILVVHGDRDHYFPFEHPRAIEKSARDAGRDVECWIIEGMAHAETSMAPETTERVAAWAKAKTGVPA